MNETILVVPARRLPADLRAGPAAVPAASWAEASEALELARAVWMPRSEAEEDPSWKQVIPYVTLFDPAGRVLVYPRQGSERRLHDLWSLGIGGHINKTDAAGLPPGPRLLEQAARREVQEEYPCRWIGTLDVMGLINEDETDVGRVHVGVCCRLVVDPSTAGRGDGELDGHLWADPADPSAALPAGARFELWSELAWRLHRTL